MYVCVHDVITNFLGNGWVEFTSLGNVVSITSMVFIEKLIIPVKPNITYLMTLESTASKSPSSCG